MLESGLGGLHRPSVDPIWRAGASPGTVLSAVSIAALSYLGFDAVATLNEEARGGGRTVARATTILLALLTGLFAAQVYAASIVTDDVPAIVTALRAAGLGRPNALASA